MFEQIRSYGLKMLAFAILFASLNYKVHSKTVRLRWSPLIANYNSEPINLLLGDALIFECDPSVPSLVYRVSQQNFDSCTLDDNAELTVACYQGTRSYLPRRIANLPARPGWLQFLGYTDYYFISTSDGTIEGIRNKEGGLCRAKDMRIQVFTGEKRFLLPTDPVPFDELPETFQEKEVLAERVPFARYLKELKAKMITATTLATMLSSPPVKEIVRDLVNSEGKQTDRHQAVTVKSISVRNDKLPIHDGNFILNSGSSHLALPRNGQTMKNAIVKVLFFCLLFTIFRNFA